MRPTKEIRKGKNMDNLKIGNYIQNLRKERGLTQKELADKLNISFQAVSKWETSRASSFFIPENMPLILVTLLVLKLVTLRAVTFSTP